jgi:hypothetical protein
LKRIDRIEDCIGETASKIIDRLKSLAGRQKSVPLFVGCVRVASVLKPLRIECISIR